MAVTHMVVPPVNGKL